ncbi:MAG: alpha/beta hydrolase [Planctomycetaceae bacterium]|nr:alpha/beta hydrolase [Planctomycetaceae bacterium]
MSLLATVKKLTFPPITWLVLTVAVCRPASAGSGLSTDLPEAVRQVVVRDQFSNDCDVWLVNSRNLPCPRNLCEPAADPQFYHREQANWLSTPPEDFYETVSPNQIICVYVHGNRISNREARRRGLKLYRLLGGKSGGIRFVIWSWNSDQVRGRIRDARIKATRADYESFQLASFLSQLPANSTVSLIGYSFGSRIVAGSLHILAGGQFRGNKLGTELLPAIRPRAILLAGAFHHSWLRPGGAFGLATTNVDHIYSTINRRDPALKHFYVTSKYSKPKALGYVGIGQQNLGPNACRVTQHDISNWVGWTHRFDRHIESGALMRQVRHFALWNAVN